jgi:hypothetical protein
MQLWKLINKRKQRRIIIVNEKLSLPEQAKFLASAKPTCPSTTNQEPDKKAQQSRKTMYD